MGKFNTTCTGIPDLDGSCEITGVHIKSYTSSNALLGTTTDIKNHGSGSDLDADVTFNGVAKPYKIKAKKNAKGDFKGNADKGKSKGEETWVATATTIQPAVAAKAY